MEQIEIIREFVALPAIFDKRAIAAARWRKVSSCCQSRKQNKRKRELKTDSLGKTQRSESQKGEIAVSMRQLVMELIEGVEGGKSALHAKSHTKVRQGAGGGKGGCVFSIDLSAFNCRQAANETRPANRRGVGHCGTCRSA